jgi:hypothetical protein
MAPSSGKNEKTMNLRIILKSRREDNVEYERVVKIEGTALLESSGGRRDLGEALLSLEREANASGRIRVWVTDTGVGRGRTVMGKRKPSKKNEEPTEWAHKGFGKIMAAATCRPLLPDGVVVVELNRRELEVIDALASKWLDAQKGWVAIGPDYKKFKREARELLKRARFLLKANQAKGPNIVNRVRGKKIEPCSDGRGYQED